MRKEIDKAVEALKAGGLILYPTDTVWGIGCDATNPVAVSKVYKLKQREDSKSMLVLMDTEYRVEQYIDEVPEVAWQLFEAAVEPLTIILPGAKNLAPNLVANDQSIGIRIPDDAFCQQLIQRLGKPLVSTSANVSGEPAPAIFPEIDEVILNGVDHVVDYRRDDTRRSRPSGIIKVGTGGQVTIIRK